MMNDACRTQLWQHWSEKMAMEGLFRMFMLNSLPEQLFTHWWLFVLADICLIISDQTLPFKLNSSQCIFYSYLHAKVLFCPIPLRIKPHLLIRFGHYEGSTGIKHLLVTDLCHCSPIRVVGLKACILWMNNMKYVKECTYDLKIYFQKHGIVTLSVYVCKA